MPAIQALPRHPRHPRHWICTRSGHGLGRFLRGSAHRGLQTATNRRGLALNLREAVDEGGVNFVKLGQVLVRYPSPGSTVGAAAFRLVTETGLSVPTDIAAEMRFSA